MGGLAGQCRKAAGAKGGNAARVGPGRLFREGLRMSFVEFLAALGLLVAAVVIGVALVRIAER